MTGPDSQSDGASDGQADRQRGPQQDNASQAPGPEAPAPAGRAPGRWRLLRSPLTWKIVLCNVIAMNALAVALLLAGGQGDRLTAQRQDSLRSQAVLMAEVLRGRLQAGQRPGAQLLADLPLGPEARVMLLDPEGSLLADRAQPGADGTAPHTYLADMIQSLRRRIAPSPQDDPDTALPASALEAARSLLPQLPQNGTARLTGCGPEGHFHIVLVQVPPPPGAASTAGAARTAGAPGREGASGPAGAASTAGQMDTAGNTGPAGNTGNLGRATGSPDGAASLAVPPRGAPPLALALAAPVRDGEVGYRLARERSLRLFLLATLASVLLSLALAWTIASPLARLADAVELGRARRPGAGHPLVPGRVRIPAFPERRDEVGRLSEALRGMVDALYDRIDANEQFAADVAHELKNPLASLRSAVGTLRQARPDQQGQLMDVIEHDVRRLDRLVSDISNASRLDSELVREEEEAFDLLQLVTRLAAYFGAQAAERGIDLVTDLPDGPLQLSGLEERLAQVFVNLITNALSFCAAGDTIRIWVRRRENRVLVVVEDSGPGIPEEALTRIFARFYSHRPERDFGNNSGLGLAISKQIVEAHGGVLWAENIRPAGAEASSAPLGARFVVGLPV